MTLLLVVLLALLWGAVFMPAILRARQESSPLVSVGTFRRGMRALSTGRLSGSGGRWVLMPRRPEDSENLRRRTLMRRKRVFFVLLALSILTGLIGLIPGARDLLRMHLALDLMLAGYVVFLIQLKQQRPGRHSYETETQIETEEPEYLTAEHF